MESSMKTNEISLPGELTLLTESYLMLLLFQMCSEGSE